MSENSTEQTGEQEQQAETKPTETVDFWKAKAREQEKRAKDNAAAAKRLQELEDATKSDQERATERVTAAEKRAEEALVKYQGLVKAKAIADAATTHRAIDGDVIAALIADQVQVDDSGNPVGIDKAVKDLIAAKPHLFKTAPAGSRDAAAGTEPNAPAGIDRQFVRQIFNKDS